MRACGRIGDGVVHQIDHQLHHQARIDVDERWLVARHYLKVVLAHSRIYVAQRLLDDIVHELERDRQAHATTLELGDGEQVLDGGVEPLCIRANGQEHAAARLVVEHGRAGRSLVEQHIGIARNTGKRRAQVVRDGAQQVGTQLLIFSEHRRLLAGLHGAGAIERQLSFAHDGIGKCPLLVRQHVGLGNDSQHAHHRGGIARAHHGVARAHGQVDAVERRAAVGGIERRSHIGGRREPWRHLRHQLVHRRGIAHGRVRRARQQVIVFRIGAVPHDRTARKTRQLRCHSMDNLLLIGAALQHAIGLEYHLRTTVAGGGLRQGTAQGQRNRARHERDRKHDKEHAGIDAVDERQRVARVDKQIVVERHGGSRAQQAIQAAPGKESAQLHGEHIDDHDARRETRMVEQRARNRRRDQQPRRYAGVIQRAATRQRRAPPPKVLGNIAVRMDVHQRPAPLSKTKTTTKGTGTFVVVSPCGGSKCIAFTACGR